jgi:poly(hydroxyalkanoate) granule-associated protein
MNITSTLKDTTQAAQDAAGALFGTVRTVAYAGLGVVAVLQEEASETFQRLVREGQAVEAGRPNTFATTAYHETRQEAAKAQVEISRSADRAETATEEAAEVAEARARDFQDRVSQMVATTLQRMNVPTREDVEALQRAVEVLDKKTAELRAA